MTSPGSSSELHSLACLMQLLSTSESGPGLVHLPHCPHHLCHDGFFPDYVETVVFLHAVCMYVCVLGLSEEFLLKRLSLV